MSVAYTDTISLALALTFTKSLVGLITCYTCCVHVQLYFKLKQLVPPQSLGSLCSSVLIPFNLPTLCPHIQTKTFFYIKLLYLLICFFMVSVEDCLAPISNRLKEVQAVL